MSTNPGGLEQGSKEEELDLIPVAASTLPTPESIEEGKGLPAYPPGTLVPKGVIGAAARTFKGVPSCVWVINQHYEEITVVVSKYRPNRLVTGGDIEISLSGGAVSLNTTVPLQRRPLILAWEIVENLPRFFHYGTNEMALA
ncbi:hypothetical protein NUW58_g998 [Xylaria curta]|uniref:Uncharacterized protein n=2 Tax=Xylaria curta TaxID=42375 RepID=A0ACC1MX26_9PEZI|nr:hypothetical protein NUW58_g9385 [Xylaria curta]KAJ2996328.1 hypothetical protein NUW58_g998 [Xylaria curta]